jgi:hypothetical protein
MTLMEIIKKLELETIYGGTGLDAVVSRGYASDLLSDVIANTEKGDIWVTLQIHPNIAAVASMKELAGIVIINGRRPETETVNKAKEENIPILVSQMPAFEVIGRLYKLGIGGT